jgi:hypothetical protein
MFAITREVRSPVAGTVLVAGWFEGADELRDAGERPREATHGWSRLIRSGWRRVRGLFCSAPPGRAERGSRCSGRLRPSGRLHARGGSTAAHQDPAEQRGADQGEEQGGCDRRTHVIKLPLSEHHGQGRTSNPWTVPTLVDSSSPRAGSIPPSRTLSPRFRKGTNRLRVPARTWRYQRAVATAQPPALRTCRCCLRKSENRKSGRQERGSHGPGRSRPGRGSRRAPGRRVTRPVARTKPHAAHAACPTGEVRTRLWPSSP